MCKYIKNNAENFGREHEDTKINVNCKTEKKKKQTQNSTITRLGTH